MLKTLQVKNYVLIDSLEIDFPAGLNIITGQTGAGKSILLGALALVLGSKADVSMVGEASDVCVVEAEFDVSGDAGVMALVESEGLDADGGHLLVRRVLNKSGRSRSFVNDEPVSVKFLSVLSGSLLDIHSQHQTLRLGDRQYQLSILDYFAGNSDLLESAASSYSRLTKMEAELRSVKDKILQLEADREYNESRFSRLDEAGLREGELEELEAEQKQLANAEEIKTSLAHASALISPEDSSEMAVPVDQVLREVSKLVSRIDAYIPAATALSERIESARIEIEDILAEIEEMESNVTVSSERLAEVEDRLSLLYDLMQKFACRDVESLLQKKEELSALLYDSSSLEAKALELQKSIEEEKIQNGLICGNLRKNRESAVEEFASAITSSLHFLEMEKAVFEVRLEDAPLSKTGKDAVTFLFSSNGTAPADVAKCASGGELSRIMLSLKAMTAKYADMPSMVFDEIDTGVSGSTADKMGSMICEMGKDMQVFAITHLPQVAAKGNAHFVVSKTEDPSTGKMVSSITRLSDDERLVEIARMLSGSEITPAAIENARALLG